MVNVIKDENLNKYDTIAQGKYYLDDKNTIKGGLILIYIYYLPELLGHGYKVGMTRCKLNETFWHALEERVAVQEKELVLNKEDYEKYGQKRQIVFWGISLKDYYDDFKDHALHKMIMNEIPGIVEEKEHEWFRGKNLALENITNLFYKYRDSDVSPYEIYNPRDEQKQAIEKMKNYFENRSGDNKFLLNCKMRFGKCYTVYKYAEESSKKKILILTFVPAVEEEWNENLKHIKTHYDYYTDKDIKKRDFRLKENTETPYVLFLSLQNLLGKDPNNKEIKEKIEKLRDVTFDLLVLDEYHFGAWNDNTKEVLEDVNADFQKTIKKKKEINVVDEFKISVKQTICLSGTPFKALDRGDFTEENSFSYSYFDEQRNKYPKSDKNDFSEINPKYARFPDMKIYGYNMASLFESNQSFINKMLKSEKALNKERSFFSLNKFFETERDSNPNKECVFVNKEEILTWLLTLRGLKYEPGFRFPYMPNVVSNIRHSLWLMPTVNACVAMAKLLRNDDYFGSNFEIINLSAPDVGAGAEALYCLHSGINKSINLQKYGTISLTVNKLTLGVTVEEWSAAFVLKDLSSPEQYFQSIFRIQTPQIINNEIIKKECSVYDFNIDRAATLLLKYAEEADKQNYTKLQVADLIVKYMPIYLNGDVERKIEKDIFYDLATYGDTSRKPLSKKISNTNRTTRCSDPQVIKDMEDDEECMRVINKVFAHSKIKPSSDKKMPMAETNEDHRTLEYKKGLDLGYQEGKARYLEFANLDDCQDYYYECSEECFKRCLPQGYNETQTKRFHDGIVDGYAKGINAPIKKMQCGTSDGVEFANVIKEKLGSDIKYNNETKTNINNMINEHLNNIENIPKEYQGQIYKKWYCDSFKSATRSTLKDAKNDENQKGLEDFNNVLEHILQRVFEFLYISVYRETTFQEIFTNANPDVFLSAVGITKEDFQILNKYHIFQENVLDMYIHEFFVNETLGKNLTQEEKKNNYYRNSFNWFGFGVEN